MPEVTLDHLILDHLSFSELHELLDGRHERQPSILAKSLEYLGVAKKNEGEGGWNSRWDTRV